MQSVRLTVRLRRPTASHPITSPRSLTKHQHSWVGYVFNLNRISCFACIALWLTLLKSPLSALHRAINATLLHERFLMDLFRVSLNCIDTYQATPTEFDPQVWRENGTSQGKTASRVPVIRVFGATETGQKVCAHIHGAFPYLFIEYSGSLLPHEGMWNRVRTILRYTDFAQSTLISTVFTSRSTML